MSEEIKTTARSRRIAKRLSALPPGILRRLRSEENIAGHLFYLEFVVQNLDLTEKNKQALSIFHYIELISSVSHLRIQKIAAHHGVNAAETFILLLLRRFYPHYSVTPSEIRDAMGFTSGGVTKRVDRLEGIGLVVRNEHPSDRRAMLVTLTQKGKETAKSIHHALKAPNVQGRVEALFSVEEMRQSAELLQSIAELIIESTKE